MVGRSAHVEGLDPDFYIAVGKHVAAHRLASGQTQEQVAATCGLTRSSIANLEAGRQHVPAHTLAAIAKALDVKIEDLMPDAPLPDLGSLLAAAQRLRAALDDFVSCFGDGGEQ